MALTRRQFLKRTGLMTAGGFLGSGLLRNPLLRRALADTIGDRYFVVLYLDGGNDGLNTVTPVDDGGGELRTAYELARLPGAGGLRLSPDDLGATLIGTDPATGAQLALHPGLAGLKSLYDDGVLAVVQGCGYPEYSLSHDESTTIWETGSPLVASPTGWMGRYLAANYVGADIPAVSIASRIAGELRQTTTSVLAVRQLRRLRFPFDGEFRSDDSAKRDAFLSLQTAAAGGAQPIRRLVGEGGTATLLASESYPQAHDLYETDRPTWDQRYDDDGSGVARDLREVAKVIYALEQGVPNVDARFFHVRNGGYDTHSDQGGAEEDGHHYALHREVGDALRLFYDDLADMGVANKLCVLVWSEFSRRVPQNENGTDHGSQGPTFVLGGTVQGGIYGNHPNIAESALDDDGNTVYSQAPADAFRSTDIRDVYGTLLKHWLGMPHATILTSVLPLDPGAVAERWTAENFDLGFLT